MIKVVTMLLLPLHFGAEQLLCERAILAGLVSLVVVVMVITALVLVDVRCRSNCFDFLSSFFAVAAAPFTPFRISP
jgi:hypothetical protein